MSEEHEQGSSFRSWAIVIAFSACIVAWGLVQYVLIPDAPRAFDYGAIEDVPGQSKYSVEPAPAGTSVPKQISPLPEAVPVKSAKKPGEAPDRSAP